MWRPGTLLSTKAPRIFAAPMTAISSKWRDEAGNGLVGQANSKPRYIKGRSCFLASMSFANPVWWNDCKLVRSMVMKKTELNTYFIRTF